MLNVICRTSLVILRNDWLIIHRTFALNPRVYIIIYCRIDLSQHVAKDTAETAGAG